jgi:hypothetical protein
MKKVIGVFIVMLLIATVVPAVGTMNEKEPYLIINKPTLNNNQKNTISINNDGNVLWDNGLHYHGYFPTQWDPLFPFDCIMADDFLFEETTIITGVNWIGGYMNPANDGDFDWNITFYEDAGDGNKPGNVLDKQIFTNEESHETYIEFIEDPEDHRGDGYVYSYWVDLKKPITFSGGEKYWITIQGLGGFPPQSTWGSHAPIVNHNFVIQSNYFEWPDWTDYIVDWQIIYDTCFQLIGEGDEPVPNLDGDGSLQFEDVPTGALVNGTITIRNIGDIGSMLEWEVQSVPEEWGENWKVRWLYDGEINPDEGGFVGTTNLEEIFIEVQTPDEKNSDFTGEIFLVNVDNPGDTITISVVCNTPRGKILQMPLLRFLENYPALYSIISQLLQL